MQIPILAWVFQGIPESIALVYCIMGTNQREIDKRILLKIALIDAVAAYGVRFLPLSPGIHIILLITNLAILCSFFAKIEMKKSLTYSIIVMCILILIEVAFNLTIVQLGIATAEKIKNSVLLRICFGLPQVGCIFLLTYLYRKKKYFS